MHQPWDSFKRRWAVFTVAVGVGFSIFGIGFRLTDEVIVVAVPLLAIALFGGMIVSVPGWLWGVGMGTGIFVSKLYPPPPYVPDARHLALYGPPQPLPLPFGLVASPVAQQVAGSLIFVGVPTIVAALGWSVKRVLAWEQRL